MNSAPLFPEEFDIVTVTRQIVREELDRPVKVEIKLSPGASMPSQPYRTDACWDMYASKSVDIPACTTIEVPTGVYINVPEGYEGELKTRSSWGKNGLIVHHSVYDCGYQGELSPFVHNISPEDFHVSLGDRVAQFTLRRKVCIEWTRVDSLSPSARGTKGHGSSGK